METRNIYYIDQKEDSIEVEVEQAMERTMEENLDLYCQTLKPNFAMINIEYLNPPVRKVIYYLEDESGQQ